MEKSGSVLVLGGGIGGIQASLDLAESGFKVYLVEKKSGIGGTMSQLDKTFPTNDCSICILSPKLVETGRHTNIEVITNAEIESIEGEPGDFHVKVRIKPRFVDPEKCTGCGLCSKYCPAEAPDIYNENLMQRSAIYILYPQSVPLVYIIDRDACIGCGLCSSLCLAEAINYEDREEIRELHVGAIILAPGFDEFNPSVKTEYGYGRYPNVVTSIEFERMLSASGPFQGHVLRPSDGKIPEKIAFIQCVGSREVKEGSNPYCSSVCCMYAVKEAVIATEHIEGVESTIFFMDIRTFGKDFDKYMERARDNYGVRMIRSRVSHLEEDEEKNLVITYEDEEGKLRKEKFDLVVLSVGFNPPENSQELRKKFGIELNKYGFAKTGLFTPLDTGKEGVYVAGAFSSPKDIPETVAEASGAAARVMTLLKETRGKEVKAKEYPPERPVFNQPPRVGVFICHCGINIGGYINVKEVVEYIKSIPGVVYATDNLYTCSQDTQEKIKEIIKEYKLNRVVVASCTPRTHEPLFQETLKEAGLNKYLFEMANIRDQDSWVHMRDPVGATEKAKDLVREAVLKAMKLEPLEEYQIPVTRKALVVGGGISGMMAALELADMGYETHIVEKEKELGGNARNIKRSVEGLDVQKELNELVEKVKSHEKIVVHTEKRIEKVEGYVGNYKTYLTGEDEPIEHGVVIIATGAKEYVPKEYLYGKNPRVLTQREFEEKMEKGEIEKDARCVMIQCVGSRNTEHPWCSRICCSRAVRNALDFREKYPDGEVIILFRDMRTYGFREDIYREAREKGVIFIRFNENDPPEVTEKGNKLQVTAKDLVLGQKILIDADYVVLSNGIVPNEDNEELSKMFKVPLNEDGFFLEAHMKLRPVDFATDGVFLCGLAHSPRFIDEAIAQAKAAAGRAALILSKDYITTEGKVAEVNERLCIGCGLCEEVCPYSAVELLEKKVLGHMKKVAQVNPVLCKGCGACTATCRPGAIDLNGFSNPQIVAQGEALLYEEKKVSSIKDVINVLK